MMIDDCHLIIINHKYSKYRRSANVGGTPVHWACAGNNPDGLLLLLARFFFTIENKKVALSNLLSFPSMIGAVFVWQSSLNAYCPITA